MRQGPYRPSKTKRALDRHLVPVLFLQYCCNQFVGVTMVVLRVVESNHGKQDYETRHAPSVFPH